MTVNARIHAPDAPRVPGRSRAIDAGYFEDWSAGRDKGGLWLWPEPVWHAYVIRPTGAMIDIVSRLGGVRMQHHRYDSGHRRDWLIPDRNWRALRAALPELIALRRRYRWEAPIRNLGCWRIWRASVNGTRSLIAFSEPSRTFPATARSLGARFSSSILDRPAWHIPADHPGAAEFAALVEDMT